MKYDFDTVSDRRGTSSSKWDVAEGELPMTIADMDFMTCPEIMDALRERLDKGIFGYTDVPERWREAAVSWWDRRYGLKMDKEWLVFSTGVVPTISCAVRKLTTPGEKVMVMTPVYNIFFNSIVNNGRVPLSCPLAYGPGGYGIDWTRTEEGLSDPQVSLMILCNPHNPVGRVWERDELQRIAELCLKYGVTVLSDEIHCDLTDPGVKYTPFLSVSDESRRVGIMAAAPTKTFGIPGLQPSFAVAADPVLRHRIWRQWNTDECGEPGVCAAEAAIAAWEKGERWLEEARERLYLNKTRVRAFVGEKLPDIRIPYGPATYLLWLDVSAISPDEKRLAAFIRRETGLCLTPGSVYGKGGEGFLRMNTACPEKLLEDGLSRLEKGVRAYRARKASF